MESPANNPQRITIHTTEQELMDASFDLPPDELRLPFVEVQVFARLNGQMMETRMKTTRELLQQAPREAREVIGSRVLSSMRSHVQA